jgi:anti-sigma B factor antagonist
LVIRSPGKTPGVGSDDIQGGEMVGEPQPFSHQIESDQTGRTILRLNGDLDMVARPALTKVLHELQHGGAQEIVVDLRGLAFLDSMGLSALLEAYVAGQDGHRKVSFIRGGRSVQRVFAITEVDKRVEWTDPPV